MLTSEQSFPASAVQGSTCDFQSLKLPAKLDGPVLHPELSTLSDQIDDLIRPYECLLPAGSPRVQLTPPFALLKLRRLNKQLNELRQLDTQPNHPAFTKACLREEKFDEKLPFDSSSLSSASIKSKSSCGSHSIQSQKATARLRQPTSTPDCTRDEYLSHLSRQIEEERMAVHFYLSNHSSETFKAADHQQIIVQESVTCSSMGGYTCQGPHLRAFAFYSAGDQSVGQIIQMLINCRSEICHAKGCNQSKSIHQTNWIHGDFKATIQMHPLDHTNRQSVSRDSQPSDHSGLPEELNIVRKTLIDKAVEWDGLFATFESRFVASDSKEARQLPSVPLKKIFSDQSMPGSPERLFPNSSQAPSVTSQKYNYNSQSEVESDHAPEGQSFGTFKKAFPSPTLKSMAGALAFALPASMPGIGIPDMRSEGEEQNNNPAQPIGPAPSVPLGGHRTCLYTHICCQ